MLFLATALAHSPHDVANFVATAPDGQVWTTDTEVLAWTTDGVQFEFFYPEFGYPVCGFADSGGALMLATEEHGVWYTDDNALTWTERAGPLTISSCGGPRDQRVIGGAEGVWLAGDVLTELPGLTGVRKVDAGGGTIAALADAVYVYDDGWTMLDDPPEVPVALGVDTEGRVWVGAEFGLYRYEGGWIAVDGPADARTFGFGDGLVLIGTSREGLYASVADGPFELYADNLEPLEDGPGAPGDGVHFLDTEVADDGTWWSAQWEGIWRLEDVWREGSLDNIPRTRTVQWGGDDDLLIGVYGGGVYRGSPGGDWTLWSTGVGWPYPKQVLRTPTLGVVLSGVAIYLTADDGETWTTGNVGIGEVGDHVTVAPDFPTTPNLVATGRDDRDALVVWSEDFGATWTRVDLDGTCEDKPTVIETDGARTWIGCGPEGEVSLSADLGKSWALMRSFGGNVNDILAETPALFATDIGLYRSDDGVAWGVEALEDVTVDRVLRGPDGTLWVAVPGQGVGRIEDGEFVPCGWPEQDRVEDLAISGSGRLAAGTREGAWVSDDCVTWERANNFEFLDEITQYWRYSEGWEMRERTEAWAAQDLGASQGAWAELEFIGEEVSVRGSCLNGATLRWTLDGVSEEQVIEAGERAIVPLWSKQVAAGVHRLTMEIIEGTVYVDGAEVWRQAREAEADSEDTGVEPEPRCGCGSKQAAAGLGLLGVLGLRRRRSRP